MMSNVLSSFRAQLTPAGGSLMDYIRGTSRNQVILFPESV